MGRALVEDEIFAASPASSRRRRRAAEVEHGSASGSDERPVNRAEDGDAVLRAVVEGTASETGVAFYRALVRNLALALGTRGAWLTEYDGW